MEEITESVVGGAWETMGVSGALFIIVVIVLGGGGFALYRLAMNWIELLKQKGKSKTSTEVIDDRNAPGKGTMMGIAREEVDRARETAKEKLDTLETKVDGNKTAIDQAMNEFKEAMEKKFGDFKDGVDKKLDDASKGHTDQEGRIANLEGWREGKKNG